MQDMQDTCKTGVRGLIFHQAPPPTSRYIFDQLYNRLLDCGCVRLYNTMAMWARAVWLEDNEEQEGVIPQKWIQNQMVHWPPGVNAAPAMAEMRDPTPSWRKFTLVKVKIASDDKTVCEECNTTTTSELSDEEENVKRRKKKKIFEDFYVADECNDMMQEKEKKCGASLPKPPEKFVRKQLIQQKKSPQKRQTQVFPTRTSPRKRVLDSSQKGIPHSQALPRSSLELSCVSQGAGPSSQGTSHGMGTDDMLPMSDGKFQKKVLFILSSIRDGIKQIQHKINQSNNDSEVEFEIKRMNSIAEVQENEKLLQDPESLKHAISRLSRIGGISMKDAVAQAMQRECPNSSVWDRIQCCRGCG